MRDPITGEPIPAHFPPASPDARPVYGPGTLPPAPAREEEASEASEDAPVWGIISIGRNQHSNPALTLSLYDWQHFQREVSELFAPLDFYVTGTSESTEHGSEETYIAGGTFLLPLPRLRRTLASLALWYFQDAISLTIGGGERVEALKLPHAPASLS